jgi:hypothetical protein
VCLADIVTRVSVVCQIVVLSFDRAWLVDLATCRLLQVGTAASQTVPYRKRRTQRYGGGEGVGRAAKDRYN